MYSLCSQSENVLFVTDHQLANSVYHSWTTDLTKGKAKLYLFHSLVIIRATPGMELVLKLIFLIIHLTNIVGLPSMQRKGKFFNFFQIVTFKNLPCSTREGSYESSGVCYTGQECEDRGGVGRGNCAAGFGRCCVIRNTGDRLVVLNSNQRIIITILLSVILGTG